VQRDVMTAWGQSRKISLRAYLVRFTPVSDRRADIGIGSSVPCVVGSEWQRGGERLKPKPGDCCVFCSYGAV